MKNSIKNSICQSLNNRFRTLPYPGIVTTTEAALAFNDRYDCQANCEIDDSFWVDLSCLGEELATRIELEDRLIAAIRAPVTV